MVSQYSQSSLEAFHRMLKPLPEACRFRGEFMHLSLLWPYFVCSSPCVCELSDTANFVFKLRRQDYKIPNQSLKLLHSFN